VTDLTRSRQIDPVNTARDPVDQPAIVVAEHLLSQRIWTVKPRMFRMTSIGYRVEALASIFREMP